MDVCLSSRGLGLGVVQMRVVMYIFSTYFPYCVCNVWDRRSLCGHCRVILPTYLPTSNMRHRYSADPGSRRPIHHDFVGSSCQVLWALIYSLKLMLSITFISSLAKVSSGYFAVANEKISHN